MYRAGEREQYERDEYGGGGEYRTTEVVEEVRYGDRDDRDGFREDVRDDFRREEYREEDRVDRFEDRVEDVPEDVAGFAGRVDGRFERFEDDVGDAFEGGREEERREDW